MRDFVQLVNQYDQPVGVMDKVEAHRGQGQLHRAISVFLVRKKRGGYELLCQQRSPEKIVAAGQWANTACGNVRPNESYVDCAVRRLQEELGIVLSRTELVPFATLRYQVKCNLEFSECEIDRLFWGHYDGQVDPNPAEVSEYDWVQFDEIEQNSEVKNWAPWFELIKQQGILHDFEVFCD